MNSFDDLVTSRKAWIEETLKPWCRQARRIDLLKAESEWLDIAGKVDAEKTLWAWAWSRFPDLVHESLGIEETSEVQLDLVDGRALRGYPNSRKSQRGQICLWGIDSATGHSTDLGPLSIDDVVSIRRLDASDDL